MYNRPDTMSIQKLSPEDRKRGNRQHSHLQAVCQPSEYDCICGKDKRFAKHTGNKVFRELIESNVVRYMMKDSKQEKMKITKEIVSIMQHKYNARFLKQSGDGWQEITDQVARDKVSHALRFASKSKEEKRSVSQRRRKQGRHHRHSSSSTSYTSVYSDSSEGSTVATSTPTLRTEPAHIDGSVESLFQRQQQILSGFDGKVNHKNTNSPCLPEPVVSNGHQEFNALRSVDFDDLLNDPLFDDRELEAMQATSL